MVAARFPDPALRRDQSDLETGPSSTESPIRACQRQGGEDQRLEHHLSDTFKAQQTLTSGTRLPRVSQVHNYEVLIRCVLLLCNIHSKPSQPPLGQEHRPDDIRTFQGPAILAIWYEASNRSKVQNYEESNSFFPLALQPPSRATATNI